MRRQVSDRLDTIDEYELGTGTVDAFIFGTGGLHSGSFGAGVDIGYRFNSGLSAFANASGGYYYGDRTGLGFDLMAGFRGTF